MRCGFSSGDGGRGALTSGSSQRAGRLALPSSRALGRRRFMRGSGSSERAAGDAACGSSQRPAGEARFTSGLSSDGAATAESSRGGRVATRGDA